MPSGVVVGTFEGADSLSDGPAISTYVRLVVGLASGAAVEIEVGVEVGLSCRADIGVFCKVDVAVYCTVIVRVFLEEVDER
jgi:hypothetical protein